MLFDSLGGRGNGGVVDDVEVRACCRHFPLSCRRWDPHLPDHDLRHCLLDGRKVSAARFTLGKMMWKGWVVKIPSQRSWEGPGIRSRIPESVIVEQEEIAIQIGVAISYPPRRSRADGGKRHRHVVEPAE